MRNNIEHSHFKDLYMELLIIWNHVRTETYFRPTIFKMNCGFSLQDKSIHDKPLSRRFIEYENT